MKDWQTEWSPGQHIPLPTRLDLRCRLLKPKLIFQLFQVYSLCVLTPKYWSMVIVRSIWIQLQRSWLKIAVSSGDTAKAFGIEPKVALLSYSTGTSGGGPEVEKVRAATKLAQTMRPDYLIEGPIQYDAAIDEKVAKKKLPNSQVAGKATVFVFPDLNTGNNTYKCRTAFYRCISHRSRYFRGYDCLSMILAVVVWLMTSSIPLRSQRSRHSREKKK